MCVLVGLAFRAAAMAVLLLSVAPEVKITSSGCAPINSATCSRAVSTTDFSFDPNLYALDGLPAPDDSPLIVRSIGAKEIYAPGGELALNELELDKPLSGCKQR
jgi:hypothetical protein